MTSVEMQKIQMLGLMLIPLKIERNQLKFLDKTVSRKLRYELVKEQIKVLENMLCAIIKEDNKEIVAILKSIE